MISRLHLPALLLLAVAAVLPVPASAGLFGAPASHGPSSSHYAPVTLELEAYPYPYPVRFLPVKAEGQDLTLRMAYMDIAPQPGVRSNGQTVLLLHGKNFAGYSPYWDNLVEALTRAGYRVVAPDQIGWGKSSKPDMPYRFSWLAQNTVALLDSLGIAGPVVVLGHSTGGMLAAHFAILYPERVAKLILEDPIGLEDYSLKVPAQSDEALYQAELKNNDPEKITAFFNHYFAFPRPELVAKMTEVPIGAAIGPDNMRWAKASARAYQMIYTQPVRAQYPKIAAPTLLVVGDRDRTAPLSNFAAPEVRKTMGQFVEMAQAAVREIPRARLVVIPDCGHIPHLEHPELFQQELFGFLRE
ncbi:Pimeloyl-ACP methyl ester carboxylesterase [Verrucomicrobium sp. GAS474]|uniref:alpha/beta fold hydrolase n=1 Tax=Verrucomicrobium sp. GAS474 TaxID=1882831 RepID=UPI00087D078D|nr:alpha/beta hydrolase [Verrucomicrobium sp. GAS474]SDU03313.1 Pimeloyl-ACP methyl ester carboxylesterase [Verrucomicrobium sp. GAS474]